MTRLEPPKTFNRRARSLEDAAGPWREGTPIDLVDGRHPLVGALKGTIVLDDSVDLTEPADPDWAAVANAKSI